MFKIILYTVTILNLILGIDYLYSKYKKNKQKTNNPENDWFNNHDELVDSNKKKGD